MLEQEPRGRQLDCLLAGGRLNDLLTSTDTSSLASVQYRSLLVSGKGTRVGALVERDVD